MSHGDATAGYFRADLLRQAKQPHDIRDRRSIFADRRGDCFLRQVEFFGQPTISERFIDRVQVFTLEVFDERHLEQRTLLAGAHVFDNHGHAEQTRTLGSPPPALAGDDLKSVPDASDDDRLNHTIRSDRLRQLLESRVVDYDARLKVVRCEMVDVRFGCRCAGQFGRIRNERAETFAEGGAFDGLHGEAHAAGAADRSRTSFASARYASAPRDFTLYRITGIPWLGASPSRTLRGITVR